MPAVNAYLFGHLVPSLFEGWHMLLFLRLVSTDLQFCDIDTELYLYWITSGLNGAFATGVACQQGAQTLPDTLFRPHPFGDLPMLQMLRPVFSNLPCLFSTSHQGYFLEFAYYMYVKVQVPFHQYMSEDLRYAKNRMDLHSKNAVMSRKIRRNDSDI